MKGLALIAWLAWVLTVPSTTSANCTLDDGTTLYAGMEGLELRLDAPIDPTPQASASSGAWGSGAWNFFSKAAKTLRRLFADESAQKAEAQLVQGESAESTALAAVTRASADWKPEELGATRVVRSIAVDRARAEATVEPSHPARLEIENYYRNLEDARAIAAKDPSIGRALRESRRGGDAALAVDLFARLLRAEPRRSIASTAPRPLLGAGLESLSCDSFLGAILPGDLRKNALTSLDYLLIYHRLTAGVFPESVELRPMRRKQLESLAGDFTPVRIAEGYLPQSGDLLVYRLMDQAYGRVLLVRSYDPRGGHAQAYEWDPAFRQILQKEVQLREGLHSEIPRRFARGFFGLRLKKDPKLVCDEIKKNAALRAPAHSKTAR